MAAVTYKKTPAMLAKKHHLLTVNGTVYDFAGEGTKWNHPASANEVAYEKEAKPASEAEIKEVMTNPKQYGYMHKYFSTYVDGKLVSDVRARMIADAGGIVESKGASVETASTGSKGTSGKADSKTDGK